MGVINLRCFVIICDSKLVTIEVNVAMPKSVINA